MFPTRIDLSEESREKLVALLNQHLADALDLYSQTKQAHWNVKGRQFFSLHELFDKLAARLLEDVDTIAERATALGGAAAGTVAQAAAHTRLDDYPLEVATGEQHVETLATQYASLAAHCRSAIEAAEELGDAATADLFTQLTRSLDQSLWFLEAHLQDQA